MVPLLSHSLDAFIGKLEQLDHYLVTLGIEITRVIFDGPRIGDDESRCIRTRFVLNHNHYLLASLFDLACRNVGVPLEQIESRTADGEPPLQRDVPVFSETAQFSH